MLKNYLPHGHTAPTMVFVEHAPRYLTPPDSATAAGLDFLDTEFTWQDLLREAQQIEDWHRAGIVFPPPLPLFAARPKGIAEVRLVGDCSCPDKRVAYKLNIGGLTYLDDHVTYLMTFVLVLPDAPSWRWQRESAPQWEV